MTFLSAKKSVLFASVLSLLFFISCNEFDGVEIPVFDFPSTVTFEEQLSSYEIFQGTPSALTPTEGFYTLELVAVLFTDYAYKQRLIRLPEGTQASSADLHSMDFPDGTLLVKTFYYYHNESDPSLGKRIIESRLLLKSEGTWNAATYLWNDEQTEATLLTSGMETTVSWTDLSGRELSTVYQVPSENDCKACHQKNQAMAPLGPNLRNLNRSVIRSGQEVNQLAFLQEAGVLPAFDLTQVASIADYKDEQLSLSDRGRAYFEMNCAHCHNPDAWETPAEQGFDFRYETPLSETGILGDQNEVTQVITSGEMPFIGTTLLDEEGVQLLTDYINSL